MDRPDAGQRRRVRVAGEPRLRPESRWARNRSSRRARRACNTGNDQFWPWIDVNERGHMTIVMKDRRLDADSIAQRVADQSRTGRGTTWSGRGVRTVASRRATRLTVRRLGGRAHPAAGGSCEPRSDRHPTGCRADLHRAVGQLRRLERRRPTTTTRSVPGSSPATTSRSHWTRISVYTLMTDARNGRSSGGPAGGATAPVAARPQPGVRAVGRVLRLVAVEPAPTEDATEQSALRATRSSSSRRVRRTLSA